MKPTLLLCCLALALPGARAAESAPPGLKLGDAAPDFKLPGIDDRTHTLADYARADVLLVAFLSNHCPDSNATAPRLIAWARKMAGRSFALVAINPNHPDAVSVDELGYSKYTDGFEDMKRYAADLGFVFPYLYDGETQAIAQAYGCLCTPHLFIFDRDRRLRYKGHFDDSRFADPSTVTSFEGRDAAEALLAGRPVSVAETPPHGCSTKWRSKQPGIIAKITKWDRTPVDVDPIDAAGVEALRRNGTKRLRLFNVWATWCAPCVEEFPTLVEAARRFSGRQFELITISTDDPAQMPRAKAFLEKQGAGLPPKLAATLKEEGRRTNSYLFTGASMAALMGALDSQWKGGIPHSVLVASDGQIVWRHNGVIDREELRQQVLAVLGPYFVPGDGTVRGTR
ncbi:MAG: redoxin domain-containing protein [Opitutus sp.]|nr:redoxin domain-containing protein [Opitutus sp.]